MLTIDPSLHYVWRVLADAFLLPWVVLLGAWQHDALRESSPPTKNKNVPLTRSYMKTGIKTQ